MTRFLIMRHGESEITDRLIGRTPEIHLSRTGKKQAEELAAILDSYPFEQLICSPVQRTVETAEALADRFKKIIIIDESLIEVDFGEWTGMKWEELDKLETWIQFNTFRSSARIPGGEIFTEVQYRMVKAVKRYASEYPGKTLAVVSHGDPIKTLLMHFLGIPLDFIHRFTISTASLSILDLEDSGVQIQGINLLLNPR